MLEGLVNYNVYRMPEPTKVLRSCIMIVAVEHANSFAQIDEVSSSDYNSAWDMWTDQKFDGCNFPNHVAAISPKERERNKDEEP